MVAVIIWVGVLYYLDERTELCGLDFDHYP